MFRILITTTNGGSRSNHDEQPVISTVVAEFTERKMAEEACSILESQMRKGVRWPSHTQKLYRETPTLECESKQQIKKRVIYNILVVTTKLIWKGQDAMSTLVIPFTNKKVADEAYESLKQSQGELGDNCSHVLIKLYPK